MYSAGEIALSKLTEMEKRVAAIEQRLGIEQGKLDSHELRTEANKAQAEFESKFNSPEAVRLREQLRRQSMPLTQPLAQTAPTGNKIPEFQLGQLMPVGARNE